MPKGIICQTAVVLFAQETNLAELKSLLTEFNLLPSIAPLPYLFIDFLPQVHGQVRLDVVNGPWPDSLGENPEEPALLGAWAHGLFGPFTFPRALERAHLQAWKWPEAPSIVPGHQSFVRIHLSYAFDLPMGAPLRPKHYDALGELEFITSIASTLLQHPHALCYFNPNGEVVMQKRELDETVNFFQESSEPPFEIWSNIRLIRFDENWLMLDTIGNWQLNLPDLEMLFPQERFEVEEVSNFLRDISLYLFQKGHVVADGDTVDGPGNVRWQAKWFSEGMSVPPRQVIRWLPFEVDNIPPTFMS